MATWFITGASRGFGLQIATLALTRGHAVAATARRPADLTAALGEVADAGDLLVLPLDVADPASVQDAVEQTRQRFGGIDVLVNNAGHGIIGAVEEVSDAETRAVFEVNVFGALSVTRAVLPVMRAQRSGQIVMMSSMGGVSQPGSGWGIYGASKFALEGFSEALRNEVAPLGISVTLVEPGSFRTDFLAGTSLHQAERTIEDYAGTSGLTRSGAGEKNHRQLGDPALAAAAIVDLADREDPPLRLPLGADAVDAITAKLRAVSADVEAARDVATATAHTDA